MNILIFQSWTRIVARISSVSRPDWVRWGFVGLIFIFIALVLAFTATAAIRDGSLGGHFARGVLVLVLTLLPGFIFYLFIEARSTRPAQFFCRQSRSLGVLGWRKAVIDGGSHIPSRKPPVDMNDIRNESNQSRARRILSYFERFQASYGRLPERFIDSIIENPDTQPKSFVHIKVTPNFSGSYFIPVYLATTLCALGWFVSLSPFDLSPLEHEAISVPALNALVPTITAVSAAFFGAYSFGLYLLVWRFMRRDIGPNAYVGFCFRIVMAYVAAWMLPSIAGAYGQDPKDPTVETYLEVSAFGVGLFPSILWDFIRSALRKVPFLNITLPSFQVLPLGELDGLTIWHEARLDEEDINTVHAMATADIVDLFVSTRLPPHRVIEWIDQSILLSRIAGPTPDVTAKRRNALRRYGVVTATGVFIALKEHHIPADAVIDLGDSVTEKLHDWLAAVGDAIRTSSNFALVQVWKNICLEEEPSIHATVVEFPQPPTPVEHAA